MERERQPLRRADTGQTGKEIQGPDLGPVYLRQFKILMQEQVLVPDAYLWDTDIIERIAKARQQFIKVDDDISPALLDMLLDETNALQVSRDFAQVIGYAPPQIIAFVGRRGQEVRTLEPVDRSFYLLLEKGRQFAGRALPDQHLDHLVPVPSQHLFQRDALCQMSAPFTLYNKQIFHDADNMLDVSLACNSSRAISE